MKKTTTQFLKACSVSVALLGSAAVVAAIFLPDAAFADNGKGNGGGNGGGGGGNGGGNGNGNSGKSAADSGGTTMSATETKKKPTKVAASEASETGGKSAKKIKLKSRDEGVADVAHPSELGALNAAHANAKALENASPNSRVGRIAAYRDVVLDGQELAAELEEKSAALETLDPPERPLDEINADLAIADADVMTKSTAVGLLEADLAAAGGVDPIIEAQIVAAKELLAEAELSAENLKEEQAAAVEYETLASEVVDLTQKVEDQPLLERTALEAAANKPVTDEVEAAVKALLGL